MTLPATKHCLKRQIDISLNGRRCQNVFDWILVSISLLSRNNVLKLRIRAVLTATHRHYINLQKYERVSDRLSVSAHLRVSPAILTEVFDNFTGDVLAINALVDGFAQQFGLRDALSLRYDLEFGLGVRLNLRGDSLGTISHVPQLHNTIGKAFPKEVYL